MNRITDVILSNFNLTPAAAEVWVTVLVQRMDAGTEVRGRLTGPRCVYASTVEVAYPLRSLPLSSPSAAGEGSAVRGHDAILRRALIPEPTFWEPATPFIYEAIVELWQDGVRCDQRSIRHGLRSVSLSRHGLRVNGRPLALRGYQPEAVMDLPDLRSRGYNLVLAEADEELADDADRLGLFVLAQTPTLPTVAEVQRLAVHPSFLGWVLAPEAARQGPLPARGYLGVESDQPSQGSIPTGIHFVIAAQEHVASVTALGLPVLVRGQPQTGASAILGSIDAGT
jgi:hypothetical protein